MKRPHFWIILSVALLTCSSAGAQKITTFDAPGAGIGAGQGTLSQGISDLGITYGYYIDGSGVAHGFLRFPCGGFTTFDAPGAGTAAGQGTFAFSLNPEIALAGYYIDGNGVLHGYVRNFLWCHHHLRSSGCWHRFRPGHVRPQYQPGGHGCGILL